MSVAFTATGTGSTSSGNLTPGLPAGTAVDDILVLVVNTNAAGTITAPAGYAAVPSSPQATSTTIANGVNLGVFWKRAVSGEAAPTISDPSTLDGGNAAIMGFSGCVTTGSPWNVTGGTFFSQERATTSTSTFLLDTSTEYNAWTHTANVTGSGGAVSHDTTTTDADGSGTNGQIKHRITGRTASCTNRSSITIVPTDYGVPTGAGIVGYTLTYAWRCSEYVTGASSTVAIDATVAPTGGSNTFTATGSYADSTGSRTDSAGATGSALASADSNFTITFNSTLATGNSSSAAVSVLIDNLRIAFTYVAETSPLEFPALTTTKSNTMIVMAAADAAASSKTTSAFSTATNANLTSVTQRFSIASAAGGAELAYGSIFGASGFSATAQNVGATTVATSNVIVPVALWTGALLGVDSTAATYSHSGWGIPLNSA